MTAWAQGAALAFAVLVAQAAPPRAAAPDARSRPKSDLPAPPGIVDATSAVPDLLVELKYATPDNFAGRVLYLGIDACYLHREVAVQLARARELLRARQPELRLLAYDCLRPHRVQREMFKVVRGTPQESYVANPERTTSMHSLGCAVDLTLARADGTPLDMGTPFDHMGRAAQPRHELTLLREGKLSAEQVANRLLLREVMVRAGFVPLNNEWWHFNCATPAEAHRRFRRVE